MTLRYYYYCWTEKATTTAKNAAMLTLFLLASQNILLAGDSQCPLYVQALPVAGKTS